jgi:HK97 family phage major capsid protein
MSLSTIADKIEVTRTQIATLEESVDGDFTPEQAAESETLIARLGTLQAEAVVAEKADAAKAEAEATVARIRAIKPTFNVARTADKTEETTMGEWMSARILSSNGDAKAAQVFRTLSDVYMADVPSLIPAPIIQNVLNRYSGSRPVFESFTQAGQVASKTMEQPYVTGHVAIDTQAAEGDEVASHKYTTSSRTLTASTLAGAVVLSQQVVDWSSPSALQAVSDDFARVYSRRTEIKASTALNAAATENSTWSTSSIAALASSLQSAIVALEDNLEEVNIGSLVLYLSPDEYAKHLSLFTAEGNAFISTIPNFPKIVRGRYLPNYSAFLADTSAIRVWETRKGLAELMRISTLEWELGYSGYLTFDVQEGAVVDLSYAGS